MRETPKIDAQKNEEASASSQTSMARRRLLRLGAYVPPAIVGMAIINGMPGTAFANKPGSCRPSACRPCIDDGHGKGKGKDNESRRNHAQCYSYQQQWDYEHPGKKDD